jgi:amino acid adenylation domain-containing protein
MPEMDDNLVRGFVDSVHRDCHRPALFVNGQYVTYERLAELAGRLAEVISKRDRSSSRFAALFAHRSVTAYSGVLGILLSGRGYVPLNPKFPAIRNRKMLDHSESDVLVVGDECLSKLEDLLSCELRPLTVILPEVDDASEWQARFPEHSFVAADSLSAPRTLVVPSNCGSASTAYLLFTSGSTGEPKGVPISHRNVRPYIEFVTKRFGVQCDDRISQTFDLTFDLSVHDMFVTWEKGACLYSVPEAVVSAPAKFIRDQELTIWFSVPSVISFMSRLRLLRPALFPTLRCSLFCGEALPERSVVAWATAANNSLIENLYGPTEATIAITAYQWDPLTSPSRCRSGITPIGWPFEGQRTCVVDNNLVPVPCGAPGELLLAGSQVTTGYWKNPEATRERFVCLPDGVTWYRTGDLVVEESDGCLLYLGRLDDQVKIRGYRVELQEIDAVLREACNTESVASIAWPVQDGSADGIVAFVCGESSQNEVELVARCRNSLPDHMVPRAIHFIDEMPRNPNGKIDRRKLALRLNDNDNG